MIQPEAGLKKLDQAFSACSDPNLSTYGDFLTKEQIDSLVAPAASAWAAIDEWVGDLATESVRGADFIRLRASVASAATLFNVPAFHVLSKGGQQVVRALAPVTVPSSVAPHIHFILGVSDLITGDVHARAYGAHPVTAEDVPVTPEVIRTYYGVHGSGQSNLNIQAITAFNDRYDPKALSLFYEKFAGNSKPDIVKVIGTNCLLSDPPCDETESDLDAQYMTSLAPGVPTWFWGNDGWILGWAQDVMGKNGEIGEIPLVYSLSYGFAEELTCMIAPHCDDAEVYIKRANTELQKLGTRGMTVFVSDGDDGASGLVGNMGYNPLDKTRYCVLGGCQQPTTECAEFIIYTANTTKPDPDETLPCIFPTGFMFEPSDGGLSIPIPVSLGCLMLFGDEDEKTFDSFLETAIDFELLNAECGLDVLNNTDVEGNVHPYSSCQCSNITSINGKLFAFSAVLPSRVATGRGNPDYPTSSPYVTSVGATQFESVDGKPNSERVCSVATGAIITTGGGFSDIAERPTYQKDAVEAWLNGPAPKPDESYFAGLNRAYPDISFVGHNFLIVTNEPGYGYVEIPVDGTSASSPSLAALVTLVNEAALEDGYKPLGFLNPLLYTMAKEKPDAFVDIVKGDNKCNRAFCFSEGYEAAEGWDPASGLGTPRFQPMVDYLKHKRGLLPKKEGTTPFPWWGVLLIVLGSVVIVGSAAAVAVVVVRRRRLRSSERDEYDPLTAGDKEGYGADA